MKRTLLVTRLSRSNSPLLSVLSLSLSLFHISLLHSRRSGAGTRVKGFRNPGRERSNPRGLGRILVGKNTLYRSAVRESRESLPRRRHRDGEGEREGSSRSLSWAELAPRRFLTSIPPLLMTRFRDVSYRDIESSLERHDGHLRRSYRRSRLMIALIAES